VLRLSVVRVNPYSFISFNIWYSAGPVQAELLAVNVLAVDIWGKNPKGSWPLWRQRTHSYKARLEAARYNSEGRDQHSFRVRSGKVR
jgi:hypothetical protein